MRFGLQRIYPHLVAVYTFHIPTGALGPSVHICTQNNNTQCSTHSDTYASATSSSRKGLDAAGLDAPSGQSPNSPSHRASSSLHAAPSSAFAMARSHPDNTLPPPTPNDPWGGGGAPVATQSHSPPAMGEAGAPGATQSQSLSA